MVRHASAVMSVEPEKFDERQWYRIGRSPESRRYKKKTSHIDPRFCPLLLQHCHLTHLHKRSLPLFQEPSLPDFICRVHSSVRPLPLPLPLPLRLERGKLVRQSMILDLQETIFGLKDSGYRTTEQIWRG
jgi:hypothetical protein